MHIAYIDDSGDEHSMVLGAVIVPAAQWLAIHDTLVRFRRELSRREGFRMADELKATTVLSRGGRWRALGTPTDRRLGIYRAAMRELADMAPTVSALAVVVPDRTDPRLQAPAVEAAWNVLLERLERFCFKSETTMLLMPDDGNPRTVRKLARRKRRFGYTPSAFGGASRKVPFDRLVDDPAHRDSSQSYLMQWADLVSYAAFRAVLPRPNFPPNMWDAIGPARLDPANALERNRGSDEPPGLIIWPQRRRP